MTAGIITATLMAVVSALALVTLTRWLGIDQHDALVFASGAATSLTVFGAGAVLIVAWDRKRKAGQ